MMSQRNRTIRKTIHFLTGLAMFGLTYVFDNLALFLVIIAGSLFAFISYDFKRFSLLHRTNDQSLGTLFYPLGILIAFILLYNMPVHYFRAALLVLTISDTVANISGQIKAGNIYFYPLNEGKSLYGVIGFAVSTAVILFVQLPDDAIPEFLVLATLLAIIFEIFSWRGSDNLSIPAGSALFFIVMDRHESDLVFLTGLIVFSAFGSLLLYRLRVLEKHASAIVFFLAVYFLGVLGASWAVLIISFFVTSVMFTYIRAKKSMKPSASYGRNAWQVLANSIWAILLSAGWLITGEIMLTYLYISVVAAVTADTWASEIGPIFHRRCFSLYHGKMMTSGINGGLSLIGSLAALTGSFFIVWLSFSVFEIRFDVQLMIIMTAAGFLASMADSFLGAFAETRIERWVGSWDFETKLSANDIVNALGSLAAPVIVLLWLLAFGL